ncbi:fimbrial protein [Pseudomonas aeruginosa]
MPKIEPEILFLAQFRSFLMKIPFKLLLVLAVAIHAGPALSNTCAWNGGAPQSSYSVPSLPSSMNLNKVEIGGVLAKSELWVSGLAGSFSCQKGAKVDFTAKVDNFPYGSGKIFATNVEGIGVRIGLANPNSSTASWYANNETVWQSSGIIYPLMNTLHIEFIRTGMSVGSGDVTLSFTATTKYANLNPIEFRYAARTTKLVNKVFIESCEPTRKVVEVPMGKVPASQVRQNGAPWSDFSVDIQCKSEEFKQKPPVKTYFEGNVSGGLLTLSGTGDPEVASGVGIQLTDEQGKALPFARANAMALPWIRRDPTAEVYKLSGKARYAANGSEIKPGKADATLTYVLEYN